MTLILALALGVLAGFLLRRFRKPHQVANIATHATIYVLLFLLGLAVGGNATIVNSLHRLGLQALTLTLGSILGSVALSALLYRYFSNVVAANEE
jgi:ABC-type Na+ efflux pump permease subunit